MRTFSLDLLEQAATQRDLASPELWQRSLERSRHRRALAAEARRQNSRRKGAAVAAGAALLATPISFAAAKRSPATGGGSTPATGPSAGHCPDGGLLCLGDRGPAVAAVQGRLGLARDGVYGRATELAVEAFQRSHAGLRVTGVVDLPTWTALFSSQTLIVRDSPLVERAIAAPTSASEAAGPEGEGNLICVSGAPASATCYAGIAHQTVKIGSVSGVAPASESAGPRTDVNRSAGPGPGAAKGQGPENGSAPPSGNSGSSGSSPHSTGSGSSPGSGSSTGWQTSVASWYGPGFYGNSTACGQVLTPSTQGVANKTLPCGTMVQFLYGGRTVTVPVIDRGPYVSGRSWDFTYATANALGFIGAGVGQVQWRFAASAAARAATADPKAASSASPMGGTLPPGRSAPLSGDPKTTESDGRQDPAATDPVPAASAGDGQAAPRSIAAAGATRATSTSAGAGGDQQIELAEGGPTVSTPASASGVRVAQSSVPVPKHRIAEGGGSRVHTTTGSKDSVAGARSIGDGR